MRNEKFKLLAIASFYCLFSSLAVADEIKVCSKVLPNGVVSGDATSIFSTKHCYMKLERAGNEVSSMGFYTNRQYEGYTRMPDDVAGLRINCVVIKTYATSNLAERDWRNIMAVYNSSETRNTRIPYNMISNNCCTIAARASRSVGVDFPLSVNFGVGTNPVTTELAHILLGIKKLFSKS